MGRQLTMVWRSCVSSDRMTGTVMLHHMWKMVQRFLQNGFKVVVTNRQPWTMKAMWRRKISFRVICERFQLARDVVALIVGLQLRYCLQQYSANSELEKAKCCIQYLFRIEMKSNLKAAQEGRQYGTLDIEYAR